MLSSATNSVSLVHTSKAVSCKRLFNTLRQVYSQFSYRCVVEKWSKLDSSDQISNSKDILNPLASRCNQNLSLYTNCLVIKVFDLKLSIFRHSKQLRHFFLLFYFADNRKMTRTATMSDEAERELDSTSFNSQNVNSYFTRNFVIFGDFFGLTVSSIPCSGRWAIAKSKKLFIAVCRCGSRVKVTDVVWTRSSNKSSNYG